MDKVINCKLDKIKDYYEMNANLFVGGAQSAVWGSRESQIKRFEILADIAILRNSSILDVGCGAGDFYGWLIQKYGKCEYVGMDIAPSMIKRARDQHPGIQFQVKNVLEVDCNIPQFDYVFASGIFNWKVPRHEAYIRKTVKKMFVLAKKGTAFNVMSTFANFKNRDEYYADPGKLLNFCLGLSRRVIMRHDYMTHDMTVYIYK